MSGIDQHLHVDNVHDYSDGITVRGGTQDTTMRKIDTAISCKDGHTLLDKVTDYSDGITVRTNPTRDDKNDEERPFPGFCRSEKNEEGQKGFGESSNDNDASPSEASNAIRRLSRDSTLVQSPEAPSGPGWMKMSDKIYMNKKQPLNKGATVYKGKQNFAGKWRDVAIRFIPYDESNFAEIQFNLKLEDHPNIVRMYEADKIQQGFILYIYVVMELCSQTLKDFIHQMPFNFRQRFLFAKQIISGVAFIHKNQILHRDLNLENILLSPTREYIRIAVFGLNKQLEDGQSSGTAGAEALGFDGYRAPEMLQKNPKRSLRTDSFSLGIILSMLFSNGQHPFGTDRHKWRANILDNKGLDLSHIPNFEERYTAKRDQLLDLIRLALSHDPEDRPKPKHMLRHPFFKRTTVRLKTPSQEDGYQKSIEIPNKPESSTGNDELENLLKIAEIHVHKMSKEIDSSIADIAKFISTSKSRSSSDVRDFGYKLEKQGHYLRSTILYKISHDLYKNERNVSSDDRLNRIRDRVADISHAIKPLITEGGRSREFAKEYGLKFMEEMLGELGAVQNPSPDIRALDEMHCIVCIAAIYSQLRDYGKSIEFGDKGVKIMKRQFGENASNYKLYGWLFYNLGYAYDDLGQFNKAESCYIAAIEAHERAFDYESREERQEDIQIVKRSLEKTRQNLSKRM